MMKTKEHRSLKACSSANTRTSQTSPKKQNKKKTESNVCYYRVTRMFSTHQQNQISRVNKFLQPSRDRRACDARDEISAMRERLSILVASATCAITLLPMFPDSSSGQLTTSEHKHRRRKKATYKKNMNTDSFSLEHN